MLLVFGVMMNCCHLLHVFSAATGEQQNHFHLRNISVLSIQGLLIKISISVHVPPGFGINEPENNYIIRNMKRMMYLSYT